MKTLDRDELENILSRYSGWVLEDGFLKKEYRLGDFDEAVKFINDVADIARRLNHHPDICLHSYRKVIIATMTHQVKGITERDVEIVEMVETLFQEKYEDTR